MKKQEYIDGYYNSDTLLTDLIQKVWNDAIESTLQTMSIGFKMNSNNNELTEGQKRVFKVLSEEVLNFPKPELK